MFYTEPSPSVEVKLKDSGAFGNHVSQAVEVSIAITGRPYFSLRMWEIIIKDNISFQYTKNKEKVKTYRYTQFECLHW